ncbi:MAG: hypothetical protein M1830_004401 [Pleopsidium flavum]|nr:MAG: hypothetical protein M1830_004401 [Pleopsidium flavum]
MRLHEKNAESPETSLGRDQVYANNYYDPDIAHSGADYDEDLHVQCPSHITERRLITKIDIRVIPILSILYLLAFLDRTNIANAAVFGLQKDLHLSPTGVEYNTALTIFFVPYILFEIPSNIFLKRLSPHVWRELPWDVLEIPASTDMTTVSACMFLFGLVTVCQGLVKSYSGLLATRFFLGLAETGMFPGCFYLIGMWYKRSEAQRRFSFFFSSTTLAGAFGGLLASAIGKMSGMRGYNGWRWIFILEGTLTCVVAFAFYFLIPAFPEDAKWLGEDERAYIKARLRQDQGRSAAERKITVRDVGNIFKDFKIFVGGFMYFGLIVAAYAYSFFSPSIIRSYGFSPISTQLHSVPPWAIAFAFAMLIAYLSDKTRHRFLFTLIPISVAIAGFAILLTVHHRPNLQYAALFLVAMGCYSAMPVIVCWFNLNLGGHHRRAVGTAWQVGFGNIGGIIATYAFQAKDAPQYKRGNRDRSPRDLSLTEFEKTEKGDMSPDYRYLL